MIGVTADSNIYISGWFTQGRRADFWMIARARLFQLSFSTPLLDEICRYYWISSSGRKNGLTICRSAWRKFTQRVHPTITTGCREKRSPRTIACSNARWQPVTGDNHLLAA